MQRAGLVLVIFQLVASEMRVPNLKLSDGKEMPAIALGTYLGWGETGIVRPVNHELRDIIIKAIDAGYRHFDTAAVYHTEGELGEGVAAAIKAGVVTREDVFITTKLWNTQHRREQVTLALKESLKKLAMSYVDLYLMHWPIGLNEDYTFSDVDFMETWRGMEDARRRGLAGALGLCNVSRAQLARVLREGSLKPSVLQIEVSPQVVQSELVSFAQSQGLVVMGYSPLGALVPRYGAPAQRPPVLDQLAAKYGKTPTQVVLRWLVDRKIVPLPKTVNPKRLLENINIFDFHLEKDEIENINALNSNLTFTRPSFWQDHPYYPFEKTDNPVPSPFGKKNQDN